MAASPAFKRYLLFPRSTHWLNPRADPSSTGAMAFALDDRILSRYRARVDALTTLDDAYARLGLDPVAAGSERLSVWEGWAKTHREAARALPRHEADALVEALRRAREQKMDGGDCMEHVSLTPKKALYLLQGWRGSALAWNSLPRAEQQSKRMQRSGKAIVNACCLRRDLDAEKGQSRDFMSALAECVVFAERHLAELWTGDLNHRILFELVLSAPRVLAEPLARKLPAAVDVPAAAQHMYERAVVCLLRSRHAGAAQRVGDLVLGEAWSFETATAWRWRLAGHLVRYASAAGARVLLACLAMEPAAMACRASGLRTLKDCLNMEATSEGLPMLVPLQLSLAARLAESAWGRAAQRREANRRGSLLSCVLQRAQAMSQVTAHLGQEEDAPLVYLTSKTTPAVETLQRFVEHLLAQGAALPLQDLPERPPLAAEGGARPALLDAACASPASSDDSQATTPQQLATAASSLPVCCVWCAPPILYWAYVPLLQGTTVGTALMLSVPTCVRPTTPLAHDS